MDGTSPIETFHRIDNLCYQLVEGRVCLEPLRVLARRDVMWNDWQVAFHVLGASHAVMLERADVCLTELLTCAPRSASSSLLAHSACSEQVDLCPDIPDLLCRVHLAPFPLDEGDSLHVVVPDADTLAFAFPRIPGQIAPMTRIGWKVQGALLHIETVHTYPEEGRGVRSTTVYRDLSDENRRMP